MSKTTLKEKYGPWATVTGASSGIGKTFVFELAKLGFNIHMVGRNIDSLSNLKEKIQIDYNLQVHITVSDLSTEKGISSLIGDSQNLNIGLFIHAAGMESHGAFIDGDIDTEMKLLDLNIRSTYRLAHHFSDKFVKRSKGGILLVSSLTGHFYSPYFTNYASSKSYILTLGNSLHHELKDKGVDVSVLSPGLTSTPMRENISKDIDWSKTPLKTDTPEFVVNYTLNSFPQKVNIVPGKSNRISAFIGKRLIPGFFAKQNEQIFRKALRNTPL